MNRLTARALLGLVNLLLILLLLLFVPAWSLTYWEGWLFILVFFLPVLLITVYFLEKDPGLIESRLQAGPIAEKERSQKIIQSFAGIFFVLVFIVAGTDHRLGWSEVPLSLVIAGDILVVLGLSIVFLVFRENSFTSGTIEVGKDQEVISTGPYAVVRHPMYAGASLMLLGIPPALGSWWAFPFVFLLIAVIAGRLLDEEKFLSKNLAGYAEYSRKVRYRLIPFVW
ncbi:MAG TPA: isoprenylcysteine carboxylmethyltransferase family protein [Methanomicrobiales archaeon]|nr:isoprenylcysteine carboxylmethyltransferase family protein [Methanomicrobiales archaeon]